MKRIPPMIALFTLLFCTQSLIAQPQFPEDGELYTNTVVPRIDILIHADSLAWIYENVESEHEFRAVFVFDNGTIHDTIKDIGFRLRGNTSRYSMKKSLKVSFNTFISGRQYYGVEKMNLNGEHNDPSVSRAMVYWDILRKSNVAGARANHVQVYINGNYYGLYINVEHIDEEFVNIYFGNKDGNLYKCLYPADLTYRGSDPDLYKFTSDNRRVYELKTNEEEDDYTDLANFINILNNTPINQLPCQLEKIFNVQDYLKVAAIDILTGNWDGYIYNKNNFYLYNNPATGLFEYIPYDVDNTFGIDWFSIDWSTRNIYNWAHSEPRPLFERLMEVSEYKAQYTYYLKQVIQLVTSGQSFLDSLFVMKQQVRPFVETDPYYPLDYGYNIQSFDTSWVAGTGAHVPIGIQPFILNRNSSALSQSINSNAAPMIRYIQHNNPVAWQDMVFSAFVEDESLAGVQLQYRVNGGSWYFLTMNDSGLEGDILINDGIYTVSLNGMAENATIEYQIVATDNNQIMSIKPCNPVQFWIPVLSSKRVFINEFMASNSTTIADEYGENDDWIELYNAGDNPVWLGDKYLSDNLSNPVKWALPDTTISVGGYLLVWADDQPEQGPMHAPYKLDKESEEVGLFDNDDSDNALIDAFVYNLQTTNISQGRITDGSVEWTFFNTPTPGSTNSMLGISEHEKFTLNVWPNPVINGCIYLSESTDFSIYDLTGRTQLIVKNSNMADVSNLSKGIYILRTADAGSIRLLIP